MLIVSLFAFVQFEMCERLAFSSFIVSMRSAPEAKQLASSAYSIEVRLVEALGKSLT